MYEVRSSNISLLVVGFLDLLCAEDNVPVKRRAVLITIVRRDIRAPSHHPSTDSVPVAQHHEVSNMLLFSDVHRRPHFPTKNRQGCILTLVPPRIYVDSFCFIWERSVAMGGFGEAGIREIMTNGGSEMWV